MKSLLRPLVLPLFVWLVAPGCGGDGEALADAGDFDGAVADAAPGSETAPVPDAEASPDLPLPSDGPPRDGGPLYGDQPFSIVLLPDTQFYTAFYPEFFKAEMDWIAAQKDTEKIAFVLHLGDIVENFGVPTEWARADENLKKLEAAQVPYVVCAGNHDIDTQKRLGSLLNQTFPPSRFAPILKETFEPNKIENASYFLSAGGRTWLVVSLEFGPRNEVLTWADGIFKQNADKPAILLTHAYMYLGQQRYDWLKYPPPKQFWNPHGYDMPGTTNDGEEMFQKLVAKNDNILMVVSGHATRNEGAEGLLSTRRANGYYLHEMLSNYQGCPSDIMCINPETNMKVRGGEGTLRIVRFDPANRKATVRTFSPALNMSRTDPMNQFELPLE
jgi:hypothetical protein